MSIWRVKKALSSSFIVGLRKDTWLLNKCFSCGYACFLIFLNLIIVHVDNHGDNNKMFSQLNVRIFLRFKGRVLPFHQGISHLWILSWLLTFSMFLTSVVIQIQVHLSHLICWVLKEALEVGIPYSQVFCYLIHYPLTRKKFPNKWITVSILYSTNISGLILHDGFSNLQILDNWEGISHGYV